jgi:hypothetical protein
MAVNLSVAVRNARLDAIETTINTTAKLKIFSGAKPTACSDADPAGALATYTFASDWMTAAASGTKGKEAGTWSTTASAGTAASFRVYANDGTTCGLQGSCGQGTGDLSFDNATFTSGQTVVINTLTLTDGNA